MISPRGLTLCSAELEQLTQAIQVLVSPLAHASVDDWRLAVNRQLKQLLHADSAGFLLPVDNGLVLYSEEHDPEELARYPDYPPPPLMDGTPVWEQWVRQGVLTLADGYGHHYQEYLNSVYYQEYAGANGAHDTLCAAVSLGGADARSMAALHFWHARPDGHLFGDREKALLRVLFPAFRAGVEAQVRWGRHRADLLDTLDGLNEAVLVFTVDGRLLHVTPALNGLLATEPQPDVLREQMMAALSTMQEALNVARTQRGAISCPAVIQVRTSSARYLMRPCLYGDPESNSGGLIMIALERSTPVPLPEAELREAFGLTPAEVRVATLIARGRSNAEISRDLSISPHTARRHTERILLKMSIRSRAEVATKVYG